MKCGLISTECRLILDLFLTLQRPSSLDDLLQWTFSQLIRKSIQKLYFWIFPVLVAWVSSIPILQKLCLLRVDCDLGKRKLPSFHFLSCMLYYTLSLARYFCAIIYEGDSNDIPLNPHNLAVAYSSATFRHLLMSITYFLKRSTSYQTYN